MTWLPPQFTPPLYLLLPSNTLSVTGADDRKHPHAVCDSTLHSPDSCKRVLTQRSTQSAVEVLKPEKRKSGAFLLWFLCFHLFMPLHRQQLQPETLCSFGCQPSHSAKWDISGRPGGWIFGITVHVREVSLEVFLPLSSLLGPDQQSAFLGALVGHKKEQSIYNLKYNLICLLAAVSYSDHVNYGW